MLQINIKSFERDCQSDKNRNTKTSIQVRLKEINISITQAGNAATEDVVNFLERIGVKTGVDLLETVNIARAMESYGLNVMSHLAASSVGREKEDNCQ